MVLESSAMANGARGQAKTGDDDLEGVGFTGATAGSVMVSTDFARAFVVTSSGVLVMFGWSF